MPPQNGKLKLRDIARLTGHTVGTVSKALHDKPGLAPKTREYILKVARENGYIGNALAGSLRSGTTKTVAIILGDIANPLFSIMAKGLIAALARGRIQRHPPKQRGRQRGGDSRHHHRAFPATWTAFSSAPRSAARRAWSFCAATARPACLWPAIFRTAAWTASSSTTSTAATSPPGISSPSATAINSFSAGRSASPAPASAARAFMAEIEVAGASARVCEVPIVADASQSIEQAISQAQGVTACALFRITSPGRCCCAFSERGVRVPEDVAVIGFDDIQSEIHVPVPLTTIGCDKRAVGDHAVELLMRRIAEPDAPIQQVRLQDLLVERGTTRAL